MQLFSLVIHTVPATHNKRIKRTKAAYARGYALRQIDLAFVTPDRVHGLRMSAILNPTRAVAGLAGFVGQGFAVRAAIANHCASRVSLRHRAESMAGGARQFHLRSPLRARSHNNSFKADGFAAA